MQESVKNQIPEQGERLNKFTNEIYSGTHVMSRNIAIENVQGKSHVK